MDPESSDPVATADSRRVARVIPVPHPQGCRSYLVVDDETRAAVAVDPHLDQVAEEAARISREGWDLRFVVDTHTHADHPSGAGRLADWFGAVRVAHERAGHRGVKHHPRDGEAIELGRTTVRFLHAPGHTPDHLVLVVDGSVLTGDTLFIGGVARTDFLGGSAGELWDSVRRLLATLPPETVMYPGHDYQGRVRSTLGEERANNPWIRIASREEFVRRLTANPPPKPANMDDLLRLNREGVEIPARVCADALVERVKAGGAGSVIDVRTDVEVATERIQGSRHIPLDRIQARADEVRATPAPRFLLCAVGQRSVRAQQALDALGVQGLTTVDGGLEAYRQAGGATERGPQRMSLERQTRIAAGSLSVVGAVLALTVSPWFALLCAFVGAGLAHAGVTNTCAMGMALAKMPWNRVKAQAPAGGTCAASAPGACAAGAPPPSSGGCAAQ